MMSCDSHVTCNLAHMQVWPLFSQLRQSFRALQLILVVLTERHPYMVSRGVREGEGRRDSGSEACG